MKRKKQNFLHMPVRNDIEKVQLETVSIIKKKITQGGQSALQPVIVK